ncbi:MAG: uracil-DNA glycosylase, partial [Ghiorsea sp.]|nr:uracil-DNA glycosylase [Ghiorsea sp.]
MGSEDFQSVYLKEIGVVTPISLFVAEPVVQSLKPAVKHEAVEKVEMADIYIAPAPQADIAVAEVVTPIPKIAQATDLSNVSGLDALQIQAEACTACGLVQSRNKLVFGQGQQQADLVFIGDSPSREDDVAGQPIIGSAGQLFVRMLTSVGLERDDVYVMNGVKCRPLHGRAPKPEEFAACEQWLVHQLDMLQPKLICLLGRVVAHTLLNTDASLADLRAGKFHFRGIPVLVLDHPSYLLRSQQHKRRAWADLNRLKA